MSTVGHVTDTGNTCTCFHWSTFTKCLYYCVCEMTRVNRGLTWGQETQKQRRHDHPPHDDLINSRNQRESESDEEQLAQNCILSDKISRLVASLSLSESGLCFLCCPLPPTRHHHHHYSTHNRCIIQRACAQVSARTGNSSSPRNFIKTMRPVC